jgi:gamma-glutamyltranspeptidase / glutathione hydrolase
VRRLSVLLAVALVAGALLGLVPAGGRSGEASAQATATGTGGAVATIDPLASATAIEVLDRGGNAFDAAVAAAAVLGVTEPFSCGPGGGGFLVAWLAGEGRAVTIDHRETAPAALERAAFVDPSTGSPYPLDELVTSGLGVGVPGTIAGWEEALRRYGTMSLAEALRPAIRIARRGFSVDRPFHDQVATNRDRFADFESTRALYLTAKGEPPPVGTRFTNPDLARTLSAVAEGGPAAFYRGRIARDIVAAITRPPVAEGTRRRVMPGHMTAGDLADYEALIRPALRVAYRDYEVLGMAPPSSGGSTVGEALNILEAFDLAGMPRADAIHHVLEASRLAFADRNAYLGDPAFTDVPLAGLLSDGFAAERRQAIGARAGQSPVAPGNPYPHEGRAAHSDSMAPVAAGPEGTSTTHLTVSDRHGNVVSYTFTIEQIGGSGIVVPGRGFLLNNELTDFDPVPPHPNAPEGAKRPRSSIAPTIVLRDGRPVLALGSPGGATIITTVLQLLIGTLDFGLSLPAALAAPRASQRNSPETSAEPQFADTPEAQALEARGHRFTVAPELGAATGIAFLPDGRVQAVAEPVRRGGGSALVQHKASR